MTTIPSRSLDVPALATRMSTLSTAEPMRVSVKCASPRPPMIPLPSACGHQVGVRHIG